MLIGIREMNHHHRPGFPSCTNHKPDLTWNSTFVRAKRWVQCSPRVPATSPKAQAALLRLRWRSINMSDSGVLNGRDALNAAV